MPQGQMGMLSSPASTRLPRCLRRMQHPRTPVSIVPRWKCGPHGQMGMQSGPASTRLSRCQRHKQDRRMPVSTQPSQEMLMGAAQSSW
jgi:hypothetical protein